MREIGVKPGKTSRIGRGRQGSVQHDSAKHPAVSLLSLRSEAEEPLPSVESIGSSSQAQLWLMV
jgi:hypothetical protein